MKHMPITSGEHVRRLYEVADQLGIDMVTLAAAADYIHGYSDELHTATAKAA